MRRARCVQSLAEIGTESARKREEAKAKKKKEWEEAKQLLEREILDRWNASVISSTQDEVKAEFQGDISTTILTIKLVRKPAPHDPWYFWIKPKTEQGQDLFRFLSQFGGWRKLGIMFDLGLDSRDRECLELCKRFGRYYAIVRIEKGRYPSLSSCYGDP